MSETIFVYARTTGGRLFESYQDYWHMVNLHGYKCCELSEVDYQSDNIYVWSSAIGNPSQVFNNDAARARKCKLVNLFIEWPKWENGHLTGWEGVEEPVDEVWVCDMHLYYLAKKFKGAGGDKFRFMVLGGHPDFGNRDYKYRDIRWDFVHISYLTGVRGSKYYLLQDQYGYKMAPNGWGEAREEALLHSRWGLNLHQNPLPCLAPQRFMIFASYCLPIITDICYDTNPFICFQDALIHFNPNQTMVSNEKLRIEAIEHNYDMITNQKTFKKEIDRRVEELRG